MATLTVPSNENGIVLDTTLNDVISTAIATSPFGFEDVYLYSHGWCTDADQASVDYDRFSIGMMRQLIVQGASLTVKARSTLELAIHWPSEISEDPNSLLNDAQLLTFYTMEHRAHQVGKNLAYSLIRMCLQAQGEAGLRFFLLGHSFGCKVVCAALQDIQTDIANGTIPVGPNTQWRLALIEAATDWDNLEPTDIYGNVGKIDKLRMLVTTSQADAALTKWYPAAAAVANLFHGANPTPALGAKGPTSATATYFGGATPLAVPLGFQMSDIAGLTGNLIVADLTPAHTARTQAGDFRGGISGSHTDIFFDEIYNLIGGFFYS